MTMPRWCRNACSMRIGDRDWLFRQCRRIAEALDKGEIALAQIYGLYIPISELDDRQLKRLAYSPFAKVGFDPDEPRVPKGDPHGGEWTTGVGGGAGGTDDGASPPHEVQIASLADVPTSSDSANGDGPSESTDGPPVKWEIVPRHDAAPGNARPADTTDTDPSSSGTFGFDFPIAPISSGPSGGALPTEQAGPSEDRPS
jgi:hypothetical protein